MTTPTMPNFLLIGAAKAGTTSLYHYLQQHPQIFLSSAKEPTFFASDDELRRIGYLATVPRTLAAYQQFFVDAHGEPAVGECSTFYLNSEAAPANIATQIPNARLIAVLRQPAERAFSEYQHRRRDGHEPATSFRDALALEPERLATDPWLGWQYRTRGYYAAQIGRYLEHFPRSQLRIFLYEDLARDPAAVLREIFEFLDVDPNVTPRTDVRHNVSGIPRSRVLHNLVNRNQRLRRAVKRVLPSWLTKRLAYRVNRRNLVRETIPAALYNALTEDYRDDILALEKLIGRDLSGWLEPRPEPR